jgi:hypothetical protein
MRTAVSSSFIAIRAKASRISSAAASGSGAPMGTSGFAEMSPIWIAPNRSSSSRSPW